jgi:hypothetical protein
MSEPALLPEPQGPSWAFILGLAYGVLFPVPAPWLYRAHPGDHGSTKIAS